MLASWDLIPKEWAPCDGRLLQIAQFQALFSLLGTTYGGDGIRTFGLPDLRGNVPLSVGSGFALGQRGGAANVTLARNQVPSHTHGINVTMAAAADSVPTNNYLATTAVANYQTAAPTTIMNGAVVEPTGGQPHENRMPSLALTWVIALTGVFPSRS